MIYSENANKYFDTFLKSFAAGICIGVGCSVYLMASNKIIGAVLFSIGLLTICTYELNLFTGKIGYCLREGTKAHYFLIWVGNALGTNVIAFLLRFWKPEFEEAAYKFVSSKPLNSIWTLLIGGFMCGILMFLAVDVYKQKNNLFAIFLAVPSFILSGFEHSSANMFYYAAAAQNFYEYYMSMVYLSIATGVSNTIGAVFMWFLLYGFNKRNRSTLNE